MCQWTLAETSRAVLLAVVCSSTACSSGARGTDPDATATRTYRLGFSVIPPRPDVAVALQAFELWSRRSDAALFHVAVPWQGLLADSSAAALIRKHQLELAQLYRSRGLPVVFTVDPTDGLNRAREDTALTAHGRSIAQLAIQAMYRDYVLTVDSLLHPDYLGLAAETNLIRAIAPPLVYQSMRTMVNATATALRARNTRARLYTSVQVETAWGRLPSTGRFAGIDEDLRDFPFLDALGLSSYPYVGGFSQPEDVPLEYFSRLSSLPKLVVEGGWSSASVGDVVSSPDEQMRWIRRHMQLADQASAVAVFQLTFTDIDLASFPVPAGSILPLFAHLGLVDTELRPKPALAEWDKAFARALRASN
jgi:hypothetical protein